MECLLSCNQWFGKCTRAIVFIIVIVDKCTHRWISCSSGHDGLLKEWFPGTVGQLKEWFPGTVGQWMNSRN
jgi:hypothetical protein